MLDRRWRATRRAGPRPVGQGLRRVGITADALTVFGLGFARSAPRSLIAAGHLVLGVVGVIVAGLRDLLDGAIARGSGQAEPARRVLRLGQPTASPTPLLFGGVAWYLVGRRSPYLPMLAFAVARAARCSSRTSGPGPSRSASTRAAGSWSAPSASCSSASALAFDILVPVLWVMLVLTAVTAVQRFVKVWRQADARRGRSPRAVTHAARALDGAARRRARARGGRRADRRPSERGPHAVAGTRRVRRDRTVPESCPTLRGQRTHVLAYRAGAEVAARSSRRRSARRSPRGVGRGRRSRSCRAAPAGRRATSGACTGRVRRRRAAARGRRRLRLVRPLLARDVPAARRRAPRVRSTRTSRCDGLRAHRRRASPRGKGVILALPHLGGWEWAGAWLARRRVTTCSPWSSSRSSRRSCSSGSPRHARRDRHRGRPARRPTVGHRGAARRCATTESCACSCDRDLAGDGVEVEFFGERTTLPGGPGDARAAHRRDAAPGRGLLPARRRPRRRGPARRCRSSARAACATTSPGSPRTSRTSSRSSSAWRPSSGTCCSRTGRATAATTDAADRWADEVTA